MSKDLWGIFLRWSRCACRAARTIGAKAKPALSRPARSACLRGKRSGARPGAEPGQPKAKPEPGSSLPSSPAAGTGRDGRRPGEPGAAPAAAAELRAHPHTHTRSCPRPPGAPALPAPREPAGSRAGLGDTARQLGAVPVPVACPRPPRGDRPARRGSGFLPAGEKEEERRGRGAPPPASAPGPESATAAPLTCF